MSIENPPKFLVVKGGCRFTVNKLFRVVDIRMKKVIFEAININLLDFPSSLDDSLGSSLMSKRTGNITYRSYNLQII